MKAVLFSAALLVSMASSVAWADANKDAEVAREHYAQRDYTAAGIDHAKQAADLFGKAASATDDDGLKARYLTSQSEALYFTGAATDDNTTKINLHNDGLAVGTQAVKLLGITDVAKVTNAQLTELKKTLSQEALEDLANAIYQRGANLGAWGQANGVVQSLSKWPELRRSMEAIERLGLVSMYDYGPYRVMGRGYYKIPALMGGDMAKAERYLSTAFNRTKVEGQTISRNGFNNIYYAEVLYSKGDETRAMRILEDLIKADPVALDPNGVIEIQEAQRQAQDLLKSW